MKDDLGSLRVHAANRHQIADISEYNSDLLFPFAHQLQEACPFLEL
jgi:hypothetical protein